MQRRAERINFRACIIFVKPLSSRKTTDDPNDPDYVPNLLMGYMEEGCFERCQKKKARYLRCLRRSEIKEKAKEDRKELLEGAEAILDLSVSSGNTSVQTETSSMDDLDLSRT